MRLYQLDTDVMLLDHDGRGKPAKKATAPRPDPGL